MAKDPTEPIRRVLVNALNSSTPGTREEAERAFGKVWTTPELSDDFEVVEFLAPYVSVIRKSDRKAGMLMFTHWPRWYFNFEAFNES